jgi:hypothetical protein
MDIPFELASTEWNYLIYVSNSLASLVASPVSDARILMGLSIAAVIIGAISFVTYKIMKIFLVKILFRKMLNC